MGFDVTVMPQGGTYKCVRRGERTCLCPFPNSHSSPSRAGSSRRRRFRRGGAFLFTFAVSANYPHEAPKVKCVTKVYHPNIDLDGNVCLNVLREDWKPVLNINTIIYGDARVCSRGPRPVLRSCPWP